MSLYHEWVAHIYNTFPNFIHKFMYCMYGRQCRLIRCRDVVRNINNSVSALANTYFRLIRLPNTIQGKTLISMLGMLDYVF